MFRNLIIIFLLTLSFEISAQNKTLDSLRNVINQIENSTKNLPIKVSWNWMTLDSALSYNVYYCAADDSSLIPLKDGIDGSSVWEWQTGSTVYNYFWVKNPLMKYLKIGIVGVNQAGKTTAMRCKTYVGF